jgi:hypothetical protein
MEFSLQFIKHICSIWGGFGVEVREVLILTAFADMNLLGDNIETIKRNTETVTDASMEVSIEVNIEKTSICWCLITRI